MKVWLLLVVGFVSGVEGGSAPFLTFVASGETHAMLSPCDCPLEPSGGGAARLRVVEELRARGNLVQLDAGGFGAGSPWDLYTRGRRADSLRTREMLTLLASLGMDAVAVGDDDLVFGARWLADAAQRAGVALLSANIRDTLGELIFSPYRLVRRGEVRIAITAVVTTERLFALPPEVVIGEPGAVLDSLLPLLGTQSDLVVLLSHCGEEQSRQFARNYPQLDLVVNGHRKQGTEPVVWEQGTPVMQFGFQGKHLSVLTGERRGSTLHFSRAQWVEVDDPAHTAPSSGGAAETVHEAPAPAHDLYLMQSCPHGVDALGEFLAFVERFPSVPWAIWFIGSVGENGTLHAAGGEEEVRELRWWLAVEQLHPRQYPGFLMRRAHAPRGAADSLAAALGMDTLALARWIRHKADSTLAMHYRRSTRLRINASPTLLVNNTPTPYPPRLAYMARRVCAQGVVSAHCDSLPECLDDGDCRREGYLGICDTTGAPPRCRYREGVAFRFLVLSAGDAPGREERRAIETTRELFPAARIEVLTHTDTLWHELFETLELPGVPFYLFEPGVQGAYNYDQIASGVVAAGEYLTFRPGIMPLTWFPGRTYEPGRVRLFVDPLSDRSRELVREAVVAGVLDDWEVFALVVPPPGTEPLTIDERLRYGECARWEVLREHFPASYSGYLRAWSGDRSLTNWPARLERRVVRSLGRRLGGDLPGYCSSAWERAQELGLRRSAFLLDNQRVVFVATPSDIRRVIEQAK